MKDRIVSSIEEAQTRLDQALAELDRVTVSDPAVIGYATKALGEYITLTSFMVDLLQGALLGHPHPEARNWLNAIQHLTDLMDHTISKLAGVAPNAFPLKIEPFNLFVLMKRACSHHDRLAREKRVSVEYRAVGEISLVRADRVATAVVADVLLSNAVKFSNAGANVIAHVWAAPGHVVCCVQDQGPGISPEDQAQLFQKGNTSFGLALAKDFMDRTGGSLWCESQLGKGSRFCFRLPAAVE